MGYEPEGKCQFCYMLNWTAVSKEKKYKHETTLCLKSDALDCCSP